MGILLSGREDNGWAHIVIRSFTLRNAWETQNRLKFDYVWEHFYLSLILDWLYSWRRLFAYVEPGYYTSSEFELRTHARAVQMDILFIQYQNAPVEVEARSSFVFFCV